MTATKFSFAGAAPERVSAAVSRYRVLGDKLEFIAYTYQPGATFGRHAHGAEQLTLVLEGQLVYTFDDGEIVLNAGEAVLIPGDAPHGAYVSADAATTRTLNVFTPVREKPPDA